jgi:hypothetical protein
MVEARDVEAAPSSHCSDATDTGRRSAQFLGIEAQPIPDRLMGRLRAGPSPSLPARAPASLVSMSRRGSRGHHPRASSSGG